MTRFSKPTPVMQSLAVLLGGTVFATTAYAQTQATADAQKQDRIEVTGSRLKRADTEGAIPVTVIDRAAIEASGQTSVAELMRDVTFASFGNTKPQSGSSGQALSDIDLRGLGSNRTLVLLDGRRISKAPFSGQSQDLNSIPLAAVERIEILSDGASAVYGSDAIGGVVNIITRKNFNGTQLNYGQGDPSVTGGDTREMSVLFGVSGAKGRMFAGLSANSRDSIYTRDQQGYVQGVSSFGNNYRRLTAGGAATGAFAPVPGFACNTNGFYRTATTCSFDFNSVAANEASVANKSIFANGDFTITDDWSFYVATNVSKVDTAGRYAPTPVQVTLPATSAPYLAIVAATPGLQAASPNGLSLRHRMAAAGNRDTVTDATVTSGLIGVKGRLFDRVDLDAGLRNERYKYIEQGRNYIVRPLLEAAILNGSYNILNPFGSSPDVLNSVKNTIGRDDLWDSKEYYVTATTDLFKIDNRPVTALIGVEGRSEFYADIYDPLSESGVIEGSAGNSASGSRRVKSVFFEMSAPVLKNLELSFAGRQDSYSDSGSAFSPKVSMRWQPLKNLTLRGSFGEGFRAPTLDVLTQKPAFAADSVNDVQTCRAFGGSAAACAASGGAVQVDTTVISNPGLKSEKSKQTSFGIVYDPFPWVSASFDAYDIKINNRITNMSSQTVINRTLNPALGAVPAAFSVRRDPATGAITDVVRGAVNEGDLATNGYDISVKTDFKLGAMGRIQNQLQYSKVSSYTLNGGRNLIGDQAVPGNRLNLGTTWTFGRFQTLLAFNHIAEQPDVVGGVPTAAYRTTNLGVTYRHPTKTTLSVSLLNLENKLPELINYDGRPWNFNLYDSLGRQVSFRVSQAF